MTNKEIKLELAKAAMVNGYSVKEAQEYYDWITESSVKELKEGQEGTEYDDVPASTIVNHVRKNHGRIGGYAARLEKVLKSNNIETVGDIIRLGETGFKNLYSVGGGMVWRVDEALEELYGINYW